MGYKGEGDTKGLIKGLEDLEIRERVETIQTTAETYEDLLSLKLQRETIS